MIKRFIVAALVAVLALGTFGAAGAQAAFNESDANCTFDGDLYTGYLYAELSTIQTEEGPHYFINVDSWGWYGPDDMNRVEVRTRFGTDNDGGVRDAAGGTYTTANDVPDQGSRSGFANYATHGPRQWRITFWNNTADHHCSTGWQNFN